MKNCILSIESVELVNNNHIQYAKRHELPIIFISSHDDIKQYINRNNILFLSNMVLLRDDCPNLFNIVPNNKIGMFNETLYNTDKIAKFINKNNDILQNKNTKISNYYNTDIMVIPSKYVFLFNCSCTNNFENILNIEIFNRDIEIFKLDYRYNTMSYITAKTGYPRHHSYVINYNGIPNETLFYELLNKDLEIWNTSDNYNFGRNILFKIGGGIGDQVDVEPVIRYIIENRLNENDNIVIATHFPPIFQHLKSKNIIILTYEDKLKEKDVQYLELKTMPEIEKHTYGCSHTSMHTVDYASLNILGTILPKKYKEIKLSYICDTKRFDYINFENSILIHAGKGWDSKTFPKSYWDTIISKILVDTNMNIILIGKQVNDKQGYIDTKNNDLIIDLRDTLSLDELFYIISKCSILLSNDSCPIHIAGAFDNDIIVIPTCKHPEHILPWRKKSQDYKTSFIYKDLLCNDYKVELNRKSGDTIDKIPSGDIYDYIPPITGVINLIKDIITI